jgi:hypothetical protein
MATITATDLATEFGTDARTVRKFLRDDAAEKGTTTPGKGKKYAIEKRDVRALKSRFTKWAKAQEVARTERAAAKVAALDADAELLANDDDELHPDDAAEGDADDE